MTTTLDRSLATAPMPSSASLSTEPEIMRFVYALIGLYGGLYLGAMFPGMKERMEGFHRALGSARFHVLYAIGACVACDILGWMGLAVMLAIPAMWLAWRFYRDWRWFRAQEVQARPIILEKLAELERRASIPSLPTASSLDEERKAA